MVASVACFIQIFGVGNYSQKSESFTGADRMDDKSRDPASLPMLGEARVVKTSRGRIGCIAPVRRDVAEAGREWRILRTGALNATSHAGTTGLGNNWYCFSLARNEQSHNEQGRVWHSDTRFIKSLFIKALLPDKGRVRVQMSDLTLAAPATHALMLIGARSMCTI